MVQVPNIDFSPKEQDPNNPVWKGLQSPHAAENIEALLNPSAVLERKQLEQITTAGAKLQAEGIDPIYKEKVLADMAQLQQEHFDLLKSNKGTNRLHLTPEQQLKMNTKYRDLESNLSFLKKESADFESVNKEALKAVYTGAITPESYDLFLAEYKKDAQKAKGVLEVPRAMEYFNKYAQPKPVKPTADKSYSEYESILNSIKTGMSYQGYTQPSQVQVEEYIRTNYPTDGKVWKEYIKPRLAAAQGLDPVTADDNIILSNVAKAAGTRVKEKTWVQPPTYNVAQTYEEGDGTNKIIPSESNGAKVRTIQLNGENVEAKTSQAVFNPATGKYTTSLLVKRVKEVPDPNNVLKTKKEEQWVTESTDDYDVYRTFYFDINQKGNPNPKKVEPPPKGTTKTYKMADALKKYKGMSESEIREKLSALGYTEGK